MRSRNRSMPASIIIPELAYPDVSAAAQWLCEAFGFQVRLEIGHHRVQLVFDGAAIVVTERSSTVPTSAAERQHGVMVRLTDVQAHHARASRAGAKILRPPTDYPYGERQYTAEDVGGHVWTFSQTIADSDPASWGGCLHRET